VQVECLGDAHYSGNHWKNYKVTRGKDFAVIVARDEAEACWVA
jgi:hypothetical protein